MENLTEITNDEKIQIIEEDNKEAIVEEEQNKEVKKENLMTLKELGTKSTEEVLGIVNAMGKVNNKSSIEVMNEHGYGFKFSDLEVYAQILGFERVCEGRKVQYTAEGVEEFVPNNKEDDLEYEILKRRKFVNMDDIERKNVYMFKNDWEKFSDTVKNNSYFGTKKLAQAVILEKMISSIMDK